MTKKKTPAAKATAPRKSAPRRSPADTSTVSHEDALAARNQTMVPDTAPAAPGQIATTSGDGRG